MVTFIQRFVRRIGPLAFVINDNGANLLVVVVDIDHAARLGFAAQGWRLVVGGVTLAYRSLFVAHVIIKDDIVRRSRCRSVDNNREAAAGARVACRVGRGDGEGVLAVSQRGVRRERPLAVAVRGDGANHFTVVENRHGIARRSAAAQGWSGVVGGFAFLQRANVRL